MVQQAAALFCFCLVPISRGPHPAIDVLDNSLIACKGPYLLLATGAIPIVSDCTSRSLHHVLVAWPDPSYQIVLTEAYTTFWRHGLLVPEHTQAEMSNQTLKDCRKSVSQQRWQQHPALHDLQYCCCQSNLLLSSPLKICDDVLYWQPWRPPAHQLLLKKSKINILSLRPVTGTALQLLQSSVAIPLFDLGQV